MRVLFLIFLLNTFVSCNGIEDGWKEIKTLKTDKAAVNKLLGSPKINDIGYYYYDSDEASVEVIFSAEPCKKDLRGRGEYKVPQDTVLNYTVNIKKQLKLSDLKFERDKYRRLPDSHLIELIHYFNNEDGIHITTQKIDEVEYVGRIRFYPSKKDANNFKCSNNVDSPDKTQ